MLDEIVVQLWDASNRNKVCRINLRGEPFPRIVSPYGVCKTSTNKIVLVCGQLAGYTKMGGGIGYRNLLLNRISEVEILNKSFDKPSDFNPQDDQYLEWVYHI